VFARLEVDVGKMVWCVLLLSLVWRGCGWWERVRERRILRLAKTTTRQKG